MANSPHPDFDKFVKNQNFLANQSGEEKIIDWNKKRDEWIDYLNQLYIMIENYLKPYIDKGTIKCTYEKMLIDEEWIGRYEVRRMIIQIGLQKIKIIPVGTNIIGAKGRVNIEGGSGAARILLVNKKAISFKSLFNTNKEMNKNNEFSWKLATKPPTDIHFIDLNEDCFMQMLLEVSNG